MDENIFINSAQPLLPVLHRIACGILRSPADAEDAVQQGLMKAWAARARVNPEKFRPWLTRIIINECRNIQRYRMRVTPSADIEPIQAPQGPDAGIMEAVYSLPDAVRIPFTLRYVAGYREREVADATQLPLSTVKHRLAKAKKLLRNKLTDTEVAFDDETYA